MRRTPILLTLMLVVLCSTAPASAQQAERLRRQHRYTETIQAVLGAQTRLDGLSDEDLFVLGYAHLQRGYLLRELAALDVAIATPYYHKRDKSATATRTPYTAYFLGRYLFETAQFDKALPYFEASFDRRGLGEAYRQRARIWAAACHARLGRTRQAAAAWDAVAVSGNAPLAGERAFARWKSRSAEAPACGAVAADAPAAALRCALWAAVRAPDPPALYPLQRRLLDAAAPDYAYAVDDALALRFYDPATLDMLAYADFVQAMEAFGSARSRQRETRLLAGLSAFEAGHDDRARAFLDQTDHPWRAAYLGALAYQDGETAQAEALWRGLRSAGVEAEVEWARVAARFPVLRREVFAVYRRQRQAASGNPLLAWTLGSALLASKQPQAALAVLGAAYPAGSPAGPDALEPAYLVALAHAQFMAGPRYYPLVRNHLAGLLDAYPVVGGVLDLAQAYMAPERKTGRKRTGP